MTHSHDAPGPDAARRRLLLGGAASALLSACASPAPDIVRPPIVFMHGNGDTSALWMTTLWRFESNGWPSQRLSCVDVPYPLARDDDGRAQAGRSSSADNRESLAEAVQRMLRATDERRVVLIASSRGGNAVRDYIAHGGGDQTVSHAILCATPDHGVFVDAQHALGSEFNGAGPFLMGLNAPQGPGGDEVTPGVRWMTIRSDRMDKYAQPDGEWIGMKGQPTHVDFDGPALKGAENVVLPGADHREAAFSAAAFGQMWRFLTGTAPLTTAVVPESRVVLDGRVIGYEVFSGQKIVPTNLPLVGATVEVYATEPTTGERLAAPLHRSIVGPDGRWGPLATDPHVTLEFVVSASGHATTHLYHSALPRSTRLAHLRAERLLDADQGAGAIVTMVRPTGYFGLSRDRISLDGQQPPPGIAAGVPSVSATKLKLADPTERPVVGVFNDERIVARVWPAALNEVTVLELSR